MISKREVPKVIGKDAERFLKKALKNQKLKDNKKKEINHTNQCENFLY